MAARNQYSWEKRQKELNKKKKKEEKLKRKAEKKNQIDTGTDLEEVQSDQPELQE
ncbi:hypothetical protein [Desulfobacter latus]|uniref:Uncharacterized protein n=1 Tax=Desulfobacter latus TaxID=2292 RepID=A0A850TCU8_9BACT|nr:hypothetical protein [Desulfobacter latus]NWH06087.1 hypothetical protein [Desulfobacter latus]